MSFAQNTYFFIFLRQLTPLIGLIGNERNSKSFELVQNLFQHPPVLKPWNFIHNVRNFQEEFECHSLNIEENPSNFCLYMENGWEEDNCFCHEIERNIFCTNSFSFGVDST